MIEAKVIIDPIEDALRSAIDWHHGDKWRNSTTKGHKLAWEIHKKRLENGLKQYQRKRRIYENK